MLLDSIQSNERASPSTTLCEEFSIPAIKEKSARDPTDDMRDERVDECPDGDILCPACVLTLRAAFLVG